MRRILAIALSVFLVAVTSYSALAWKKGQLNVSVPWTGLNLQGGGRQTNQSVTSDGHLIARVDVYGAYSLDLTKAGTNGAPNAVWQQLVNGTSLATFINGPNNNNSPSPFIWNADQPGVQEIVAAPSNPNHLVMFWQRAFFYSTDAGAHWTVSTSVNCNCSTTNNAGIKNYNAKIAFDPANENIVYGGTGSNGMFLSTDGGVTWAQVASGFPAPLPSQTTTSTIIVKNTTTTLTVGSCSGILPGFWVIDATASNVSVNSVSTCVGTTLTLTGASQQNGTGSTGDTLSFQPTIPNTGIFAIVFDSSGGTSTGASCPNSVSPCTKNIYATPQGSLPYVTTNAGSSWALVNSTGAPTAATNPTMYGKVFSSGLLIYIDDTSALGSAGHFVYTYTGGTGGTWTQSLTTAPPEGSGPRAVAIDPNGCGSPLSGCRVVVIGSNGSLNVGSVTGTTITWSGWSNTPISANYTYSGPTSWISLAVGQNVGTHSLDFDPNIANKLWSCASSDCFYTTGLGSSVSGTNVLWLDYGYNTYTLGPPLDVLVPPGSPNVITTATDSWLFTNPVRNSGGANGVTIKQASVYNGALGQGWNMDYASSSPSNVYAPIIGEFSGPPPGVIAKSADYGATWTGLGVGSDVSPSSCVNPGTATVMPPEQLQSGGLPYNNQGMVAASTPCNFIYAGNNRQPWYTTDGGATWARVSLQAASPSNVIVDTLYGTVINAWSANTTTVDLTGATGIACANIVAGESVLVPDISGNGTKATVASCSGTTLTLSASSNTMPSFAGGSTHLYISPWCCGALNTTYGQPIGAPARMFAADRSAANTFYAQYGLGQNSGTGHAEFGTYKTTNGGASWTQITGGTDPGQVFDANTIEIVSVPGKAGHLFAIGRGSLQTGAWLTYSVKPSTTTGKLYFFKDNGGTGQSWTTIPFVQDTNAACIGRVKSGSSYPTIYVFGFTSQDSGSTYHYGFWRSTTFDPNNPTADPTWTAIGTNPGNGYALNYPLVNQCSASQDVYGEIYAQFNPGNWAWGIFP